MFPHSTWADVLPSQAFHSMAFTTKVVVVSSELTVVSLEVEVPPQAASTSRPTSAVNEKCGGLRIYSY
jgi:hypothetical protein